MHRAGGIVVWAALLVLLSGCEPTLSERYAGTLNFRSVKVGSLVGGRVLQVAAAEGQQVSAGELLVRLDPTEWQSALDEAEAALEVRHQELKLLQAGPRQETIAASRAEATRLKLLYQVQQGGARPEEVAEAEQRLEKARAVVAEAAAALGRAQSLHRAGTLSEDHLESAQHQLEESQASHRALEQKLKLIQSGFRPEEIQAAKQSMLAAEARLQELEAGARPEELEALEAALRGAEARVRRARHQLAEHEVLATEDALVHTLDLRPGELVPAGSPIAVLLLEEDPWITIYVPEDRLAEVRLEQPAQVLVDGLSQPLRGVVTYVSREAEFTPRNIQTPSERVTQVFAVKVTLGHAPPALKDGMWADVLLVAATP